MPVVRTGMITFDGPDGHIEWKQITRLLLRKKRFAIKLPEWMHETLGYKEVFGDTLDHVDYAFTKAIMEFEELEKDKRKVILYRLKINVIISEYNDEGKFVRVSLRREDMYFQKGSTALSLWWCLAYELTSQFTGKVVYTYLNGNHISRDEIGKSRENVIEWTLQREGFFKALQLQLDSLILKAHTFFSQEPEEIRELIDRVGRFEALPDLREKEAIN